MRDREETPHLSDAIKRRAQSIINDESIDAQTCALIRPQLGHVLESILISLAQEGQLKCGGSFARAF